MVQCVFHALGTGSVPDVALFRAGLECLAAVAHALPDPASVLQQLRNHEARLACHRLGAELVEDVLRGAKLALQARAVR